MPPDEAFKKLSPSASTKLHSLSDNDIYILIKAHIVRGYFTPAHLRSKNRKLSTLMTENFGHSKYMLYISSSSSSSVLTIRTGLVEAAVNRTVYLHAPIAIYSVSKVLLPTEFFGKN
ncbi:fasciclin-like arabinogalactan protein [Trifolium medium]|uniref:Fasciclin-like arabinogalactan protein n=1 Tax=Trifolium medium TaxID=97028 RepID=A0A392R263_9FABA|nr:fasciclin-like arabinogalactan protein [Trifolium medium]